MLDCDHCQSPARGFRREELEADVPVALLDELFAGKRTMAFLKHAGKLCCRGCYLELATGKLPEHNMNLHGSKTSLKAARGRPSQINHRIRRSPD